MQSFQFVLFIFQFEALGLTYCYAGNPETLRCGCYSSLSLSNPHVCPSQ